MNWRIVTVLSLSLGSAAFGEDAVARKAREELERELKQMVGTTPTRVRVDFISPDEPNYVLEEASFEVDGKAVTAVPLSTLSDDGTHTVFQGDVTPGKHKVSAKLVYANRASAVVSDEGGYKWRVGGDASFEVNAGLEVQVQVVPARDPKQKDISKRFTLRMPAQPMMVATLDDGKMPEPPPKPNAVQPASAAAGPVADATPAAASSGASMKRASPVVAPVDEPRRAPAAAPVAPGPEEPVAAENEPSDAGSSAAALPLATPVAAEPATGSPPESMAAAETPSMLPWLLGGGGAVLALIIFLLARRRS